MQGGESGIILFAGDVEAGAEAQAESAIAAGTYAVSQVMLDGKATVTATGDVVVQGAVNVKGDAELRAESAFEASGALVMEGNARVRTGGEHVVKVASATMSSAGTYQARYEVAADASADAALEATNDVTFAGTLEMDVFSELNTGDKFVVAKYASFSGEFGAVVTSEASADANGRKRQDDDWTMDYGANEATATYNGEMQTARSTETAATVPPVTTNTGVTTAEDDDDESTTAEMPSTTSASALTLASGAIASIFVSLF